MNPERAQEAAERALKEYIRARSSYRKDERTGEEWCTGMTIVSPDDKRIDEMTRLMVEAVIRSDDNRPRIMVETRALRLGDVFTFYRIREGLAVDEEVTVISIKTKVNRTAVAYRRPNDKVDVAEVDASYIISVHRPSNDDLKAQLKEEIDNG